MKTNVFFITKEMLNGKKSIVFSSRVFNGINFEYIDKEAFEGDLIVSRNDNTNCLVFKPKELADKIKKQIKKLDIENNVINLMISRKDNDAISTLINCIQQIIMYTDAINSDIGESSTEFFLD